jgi:hypothetical protein
LSGSPRRHPYCRRRTPMDAAARNKFTLTRAAGHGHELSPDPRLDSSDRNPEVFGDLLLVRAPSMIAKSRLALTARAQQSVRMRRIGVLAASAESPKVRARVAAFQLAMRNLGWREDHNIRIDVRWLGSNGATAAWPLAARTAGRDWADRARVPVKRKPRRSRAKSKTTLQWRCRSKTTPQ